MMIVTQRAAAFFLAAGLLLSAPAIAQTSQSTTTQSTTDQSTAAQSDSALAIELENPIGNLTSLPFQNNTDLGLGPEHGTQNTLNFEPVVPVHITPTWNLIFRTVIPLTWNPSMQPAPSVPFGLSPTSITVFLSPEAAFDGFVWGAGPIVQIPTITNKTLGSNVWGLGPSVVFVRHEGSLVTGALISNTFSVGGTSGPAGTKYNIFQLKPFINYNLPGGWFIGSVPIITANWLGSGQQWTLPIGAQFGRVARLAGKLPIVMEAGAYYNVLRPNQQADWQIRTQVGVIF